MRIFWKRLRLTLDMIKFEHSVFALPFALTGALLAWRDSGFQIRGLAWRFSGLRSPWWRRARPRWPSIAFWTRDIDGRNQRTAARHLPAGLLSALCLGIHGGLLAGISYGRRGNSDSVLHVVSVGARDPCSFIPFRNASRLFSHLILGFCLGIAPAAAWIAMRGTLDARILWLTAAVMFWTAGFDVIYACQDFDSIAPKACTAFPGGSASRGALRSHGCCMWR